MKERVSEQTVVLPLWLGEREGLKQKIRGKLYDIKLYLPWVRSTRYLLCMQDRPRDVCSISSFRPLLPK